MLFQFECAESRIYEGKKVRVLVDIPYPCTFLLSVRVRRACENERKTREKMNRAINTPRSLKRR